MNRTPNQERAIHEMARHICVDAGAGSGKTRVLIDRIIHLIENKKVDLDSIVAITFTDKAAAEMRDRLRQAFRQRAPQDNPDEMSRWRTLEHRVDTARISTIHAFCTGILRENALFCGLDPDFAVMTEAESTLLREQVITDTLHRLLDQEDADTVCAATELGITSLVKTLGKMLGARSLVSAHTAGLPPGTPEALPAHWRVLVEDARRRRLETLTTSKVLQHCYHHLKAAEGFCTKPKDAREQGRVQALILLDRMFSKPDAEHVLAAMTDIASLKYTGARKDNWPDLDMYEQLKTAQETLGKIAKESIPPPYDESVERQAATVTCAILHVYQQVHEAFSQSKTARIRLDFDDMITLTHAVLREKETVRKRLAQGIRFLLIDEFQDTDSVQLDMMTLLAKEEGGPDLFIVGDAKQSIYDFRGAEVSVFQQEKAQTQNLIRLDANFRSAPELMGFINDTFSRADLLHAVEPNYQPMTTHRTGTGACRIEFLVPPIQNPGSTETYRAAEAELIAARLDQMCRGPQRVTLFDNALQKERNAEFGDVALLFRSMTSVYLYEKALRARNIPFLIAGGTGFYERQEVADIHTLLRVLINPWDEPALLGFLRGPIAALSDESLLRMAPQGLAAAFLGIHHPLDGEQGTRLQAARDLVADLQTHTEAPLGTFIRYVLDRTEYEAMVLSQFLGIQKASNVRKLVDLADDFARTGPARLDLFVHYLDSLAKREEIREGDAVIQPGGAGPAILMSVHKSKGLEFPIVVIADTARQRNNADPGNLAMDRELGVAAKIMDATGEWQKPALYQEIQFAHTQADANESARILYVAMTRTRDWLLIGGSPKPGSGSWFSTLNTLYAITSRANEETWHSLPDSAQPWTARVRSVIAPEANAGPETDDDHTTTLSLEAVQSRLNNLQTVICPPVIRPSISVSKLLNRLFPYTAEADMDERDDAPSTGPFLLPGQDPRLRGILVHRLLETWRKTDPNPVETMLRREYPLLWDHPEINEYLQKTVAHFRASTLCTRLENAENPMREMPFVLRMNHHLLSGVIDLYLDSGILVDYKTGTPKPGLQQRYTFQLQLYAAAIQNILGQTPREALLYYLDTGEEHPVSITTTAIHAALQNTAEALADPGIQS